MITQKAISEILRPLLSTGIYRDERIALKDIVADYIQKKIGEYSTIIKRMERKHGKDFGAFSKELKGKASMKREDDWLEWKGAIAMREAWQKAFKKLLSNAA
jgi:hypothetical protein